jgi:hypothetical protein
VFIENKLCKFKENINIFIENRNEDYFLIERFVGFIYNFGICNGEIIRSASPIIIKGETKENNASKATTIPAAGIGRPTK